MRESARAPDGDRQQQGMLGRDTFLALSPESSHTSRAVFISCPEPELSKRSTLNSPLKPGGWADESGAAATRGRCCAVCRRPGQTLHRVSLPSSACISFTMSRITGGGLLRSHWFEQAAE